MKFLIKRKYSAFSGNRAVYYGYFILERIFYMPAVTPQWIIVDGIRIHADEYTYDNDKKEIVVESEREYHSYEVDEIEKELKIFYDNQLWKLIEFDWNKDGCYIPGIIKDFYA